MGFHNHSTLINMSKIIPGRNKMLSLVVDQNTKKLRKCSMLQASDGLLSVCDRANRNNDKFGQNLSKIRVKQLHKLCEIYYLERVTKKNFKTHKLICFDLNFPILRTCPLYLQKIVLT